MKQVVVGIVKRDNQFLMTRRKEVENGLEWQFPGGKVEEETPEEAVIREVREETNILCQVQGKLGERIHPSTRKEIIYYSCDYISGTATVHEDENISEVVWLTVAELKKRITTPLFDKVNTYLQQYE